MVCDLLQKIELFHTAGTQMIPPHGPDIVKALYDILTVLDSKGLALLAFDGIIVAATTFAAEKRRRLSPSWNGAMAGDRDDCFVARRSGIVPLGV